MDAKLIISTESSEEKTSAGALDLRTCHQSGNIRQDWIMISELPHFSESVSPHRLLRNGHTQTLGGFFLRVNTPLLVRGKRVRIDLPDGDALDALLIAHEEATCTVSVFHGLSGSNQSSYMLRLGKLLSQNKINVLLVNHRGCGKGITLPCRHPYHSGRGEDVSEVIGWAREKFPKQLQLAVGFSLGGSALLNLVTGRRGSELPDLAISVNAPLDVKDSALMLMKGWNKIYAEAFRRDCYRTLVLKEKMGWIEKAPDKKLIRSIFDLDVHYTAPATGHASVDDFYEHCTAGKDLENIRTPTLMITAEDDPIARAQFYRDFKRSRQVRIHMEKTGGHMGYLTTRMGQFDSTWLERCILHYIQSFQLACS